MEEEAIQSFIKPGEQKFEFGASWEFHHRPGDEGRESKAAVKERQSWRGKSYWTRWGSVTSIESQTGPQISPARRGAAWEPTAGAPCAMPPGD